MIAATNDAMVSATIVKINPMRLTMFSNVVFLCFA